MGQQREAASGGRDARDASATHPTLITGSAHGTATALHATTGEVLWLWAPGPQLGTLAHGGEIVYVPTDSPRRARRFLDGPPPRTPEEYAGRKMAISHAVTLTALRARDGAVLWEREGWQTTGNTRLALDGDLLIADVPSEEIGQALVGGLDAQTGETRWTYDTGQQWGITKWLVAACGGRVFVREGGFGVDRLHVLDTQTGAECWSRELSEHRIWRIWLSESGKLVMLDVAGNDGTPERVVLNAEDGAPIGTLSPHTSIHAVTDDGIAYMTTGWHPRCHLSAVRISDGAELWRTENIQAGQVVTTEDALYYARFTQSPRRLAEVGALDARTGQRHWQWRSPSHLLPLLRLWGRNTPSVIAHAVNEGSRTLTRARQSREHGVIRREIHHGQWRHPGALTSNIQMTAGWGMVYVATSLGLFALRASDGHLRWLALPTFDLGWVAPVVSPKR